MATKYEQMQEEIDFLREILTSVSTEIKNDGRNKIVFADKIMESLNNSPMSNPDLRKEGVPVDLSKI